MGKKVFIGLSDIASFISDWDNGFNMLHIKTLKGSMDYQASTQNSELDFVVKKYQDKMGYFKPRRVSVRLKPWWDKKVRTYFFEKALKNCNIFIIFWESFYPNHEDYELLKRKGKKIVTIFVGDDIRWEPAMKQEFEAYKLPVIEYENYDYSTNALNLKLEYLRIAEKYSDVILCQPNAMQLSIRPYYNLNIPIIAKDYIERSEQRIKPIIVHAPTSVGKGTKYIEPIIERLKLEGFDFEYKRIQNVPRPEAINIYQDADIIIDQLLTPGGGKLAHECLAMGKVVLTLMGYDNYDQLKPAECPLIDVNQDTLYEVLKPLILDWNKRTEIASKARSYIEKYHNPKIIIEDITNHLNGVKILKPDFTPVFFREEFVPESADALKVYNKWNQYIAECDWYKKTVKSGERNGLVF